jgi:hypothetical protein
MKITGYILYRNGYIREDLTEEPSVKILQAKDKQVLIDYANDQKLDIYDHYITATGYEIIGGVKVPTSGEIEFLNNLKDNAR